MAVALFRTLGQMEHSNAGAPLAGGRVYPQRNDTSAFAETCLNSSGTTLNTYENDSDGLGNYIELDSNGRYAESVFLKDSDIYPAGYKFIVRDSLKSIQYTVEDVPAAVPAFSGGEFAAEELNWIQVTAATLNLTAADAGNAYELDTTSGSITVNLPTAAATGNGRGFAFKKKSANNTATINRAGSDTIDGATSKVLYALNELVKLSSNGAVWNRSGDYTPALDSINRKSGSAGGGLLLSAPASGHTLIGNVIVDVSGNKVQVYESGGTVRGIGFDLTGATAAAAAVGFHSGIAATQAMMESPTSFVNPVTPLAMQYHPGVAKTWAYINWGAGTPSVAAGYNVSSVSDGGTGFITINFTAAFSSTNWAESLTAQATVAGFAQTHGKNASSITVASRSDSGALQDAATIAFIGMGDQ